MLVAGCAASPPVQEMSDARQAIEAAEEAGAGEHAPKTLARARSWLDSAEEKLKVRAYGAATRDAAQAKAAALEALQTTQALTADPEDR